MCFFPRCQAPKLIYLCEVKTPITHNIELAKQQLERGEVIGIPTESVYGLGANALHGEAVARIYKLKQRPESNPLILHFKNLQKATPYFHEFHDELLRLYEVFCRFLKCKMR